MTEMTEEQRKEMEEKLKNMSPEELKAFQKQQCIFCQIISGKIPSKKLYEDEHCIAILDINPATKGHVLLLPKEHYAIMPQMPDKELGHMYVIAKKLSQAILKGLKVSGTNLFVANGLPAGQRAQHFILHIIPRKDGDELLKISEKLVDKEMRVKVHELIETQFNKIMKIKKKVVKKEKVMEEPKVEEPKEEPVEEKEKAKVKKDSEKEDIEEDDSEQEDDTEETEDPKDQEEKPKDDVNASLDDIASLFK
jgi:histidine triad (HIT) family protein